MYKNEKADASRGGMANELYGAQEPDPEGLYDDFQSAKGAATAYSEPQADAMYSDQGEDDMYYNDSGGYLEVEK